MTFALPLLRFRYLGENGNWFNDPDVTELDGSDTILVVRRATPAPRVGRTRMGNAAT
ncbi:hypothetical protein [Pseudonocardia sp. H11422]|uniref:hypothetical protein n=1 Tax=Pseudonocardia sp. H11422 TaxID=2835866 RepID=UPI001BDC8479|nr:hypothetical protein [Pseudonocardia sp. H11422]